VPWQGAIDKQMEQLKQMGAPGLPPPSFVIFVAWPRRKMTGI